MKTTTENAAAYETGQIKHKILRDTIENGKFWFLRCNSRSQTFFLKGLFLVDKVL